MAYNQGVLSEKDLSWIAGKLESVDKLYPDFDVSLAEWTTLNRNNPHDYDTLKYQMLLLWRRKIGFNATLDKLVSILKSSGNVLVGDEIEMNFHSRTKSTEIKYPVQESSGAGRQPHVANLEQAGNPVQQLSNAGQQPVVANLEQACDPGADQIPTQSTMEIILSLHPEMSKYINMVSLIPFLNKYSIMTSEDRFYLSSNYNSPAQKVQYLLDSLESKGDPTVQKFVKALKEASEHSGHIELCRLLKSRGVKI